MEKGIALQGFLSVFAGSSIRSAMISQVLFGESYVILEHMGPWTRISMEIDGLEGWISSSSVQTPELPVADPGKKLMALRPLTTLTDLMTHSRIPVPAGSIWPGEPGVPFEIRNRKLVMDEPADWFECRMNADPELIGEQLLSVPFLQGGRSGMGLDGSGLVQFVGKTLGLAWPRYSPELSGLGQTLNFIGEVRKGDLAFFDSPEGEIIHSGVVLDRGRILHVHDLVRIDRLDHQGIYNSHLKAYTHHLRIIKRPSA